MGLLKKIKRTVRKVVPKEVAGIMTAAAPFVAPYSLPAAAALTIGGQLKQTGRINPILTAGSLLPGVRFQGGQGLAAFKPTGFTRFGPQNFGSGISARQLFFGGPGAGESGKLGRFGDTAERFLFGREGVEGGNVFDTEGRFEGVFEGVKPTQGILGTGGKYGITKGSLISKTDGSLKKANIAAMAASGLSLATATKQIEEEAREAGASDNDIDALTAEAAEFWSTLSSDDFKVTPTLAKGGRVGFAEGTDKNIPNDPKSRDMASFAKLKDFVNPSNYFMNSRETDDFQTMQKERFMYDTKSSNTILDKIKALFNKFLKMGLSRDEAAKKAREALVLQKALKEDDIQGLASFFNLPSSELNELGEILIEKKRESAKQKALDSIYDMGRGGAATGGLMRTNYALGTRPTAQESGLGGLPIEADMRYSGGFMPYGAKEKADDVPARLSKNEFVFTADAVRAAGGGSVQKGAQKMYNTMKQLESMGRA